MTRSPRLRLAVGLVSVAILGSGCLASGPEPSGPPPPSPSAVPRAPTPRASGPPAASSPRASADPTPLVDLPPLDVPTSSYTILCESWGEEPPPEEVGCKIAVELALSALGGQGASVIRRLDVRYGDGCVGAAACERRADVRTVTAIAQSFETLVVKVARDASGDILVWPAIEGPTLSPPEFRAPSASAPDAGQDAPADVRQRAPLPFCGGEHISGPDDFDTAVRRCFLAGIQSWLAVEMTTSETIESGALIHVLRFEGRGGVVSYIRSAGHWSATRCAISPIDTIAVFVMTAPCEPVRLQP